MPLTISSSEISIIILFIYLYLLIFIYLVWLIICEWCAASSPRSAPSYIWWWYCASNYRNCPTTMPLQSATVLRIAVRLSRRPWMWLYWREGRCISTWWAGRAQKDRNVSHYAKSPILWSRAWQWPQAYFPRSRTAASWPETGPKHWIGLMPTLVNKWLKWIIAWYCPISLLIEF